MVGQGPQSNTTPASLSAWLVERFIPAWVARAWNPALPGYVESISWQNGSARAPETFSTMVTGRLVYTFSLCHVAGAQGACLEAATHGLESLLGPCRRADGGFVHALAADGKALEPSADLYDIAFVLLALGGYAAASGRNDLLELADTIGARLDRNADPLGGFRDPDFSAEARLQYPQMHLLESFQLLARLAPDRGWESRADAIVDLAERRLIRPDGCIEEWYDAAWRPIPVGGLTERELGHQFEWAWLLYRCGHTFDRPRATSLADQIYAYGKAAMQVAIGDTIGPLPNRIDIAGRPRDIARPLWPLTELLRAACLAGISERGAGNAEIAAAALRTIFAHYIDHETGLWINALDPNIPPAERVVPSRLLYHIVPALITHAREREAAFEVSNQILDRYVNSR
jgi:mannose/cellobiose epimerase-like protein (N-acyl-D-glucosamine 2-epimerase family)